MRPVHSLQRRQTANFRQAINFDRTKVVEICDSAPDIQPINLESEPYSNKKIRPFRSGVSKKLQPGKFQESQREHLRDKISLAGKLPYNEGKLEEVEKLKPFKEYIQKLHTVLSHFISISCCHPSNKISSQSIFNMFQQRKSLHKRFELQQSLTKFLFEISYTNYLSFLQYVIPLKQSRYEIYQEAEELQKVIFLIDQEIQDITEIFLAEQEKKIDLIFTEELLGEVSIIARKKYSAPDFKMEQNHQMDEKMMLENDETIQGQREIIQTEFENTNLNQFLAYNQLFQSKNSTIQNGKLKFRMGVNSQSESGLEEGQISPVNQRIQEQSGSESAQVISQVDQQQLLEENSLAKNQQNKQNEGSNHEDEQRGIYKAI